MNNLKVFFTIFLTLLILLPIWLVFTEYSDIENTKQWSLQNGTVVMSSVEKNVSRKSNVFCPVIAVSYNFHGVERVSVLHTKNGCRSLFESTDEINKYQKGLSISMFVNPLNPDQIRSVDYPQKHITFMLLVLIVATFIGIVLVLIQPNELLKGASNVVIDNVTHAGRRSKSGIHDKKMAMFSKEFWFFFLTGFFIAIVIYLIFKSNHALSFILFYCVEVFVLLLLIVLSLFRQIEKSSDDFFRLSKIFFYQELLRKLIVSCVGFCALNLFIKFIG